METKKSHTLNIPPLQIPANTASSNAQNTNESITSFEDEPSERPIEEKVQDIEFQEDKGNIEIMTQINDPKLFSYILAQGDEKVENSKLQRKIREEQNEENKFYEESPISDEKNENEKDEKINTEIPKIESPEINKNEEPPLLQLPTKMKLTKKTLEIATQPQNEQNLSIENFGASSIGSGKPENEISPQDEEMKFIFPKTPQKIEPAVIENSKKLEEELKEILSQKDTKLKLIQSENDEIKRNYENLKKQLETALSEKNSLQEIFEKEKNLPKNDAYCGTDIPIPKFNEFICETDPLEQDENLQLKLKQIEQALQIVENEKSELQVEFEKQRGMIIKADAELTNSAKESHSLALELEAARQGYETQKKQVTLLKNDNANLKAKISRLESEIKELNRTKSRTSQIEDRANLQDKLNRVEQLSLELSKENEMSRAVINELKEQLSRITNKLEQKRLSSQKHKEKVKELKKERDLLKIEILKVKQACSDKVESYKEARNRLQKQLKEKDDEIRNLQDAMRGDREKEYMNNNEASPNWNNYGNSGSTKKNNDNDDYMRAKSLENTHKYQMKDLSATLQPGEIRKKLETDQFSIDDQLHNISPNIQKDEKPILRSKDEINDFISTHKLRDMPGFGPERYKYTPESHNKDKKYLDHIEDRIEQFKIRKAEIDSRINANDQLSKLSSQKQDPVWKKYQMQQSRTQAQQDAARIAKSASIHSDIISGGQGSTTGDNSASKQVSRVPQRENVSGGKKVGSRPPSGTKQEYQKNIPSKTRDYTPQMARAHAAPVGLYSPNSNMKTGLYLSQLSPHPGDTKIGTQPTTVSNEHMENILIQTLSPRGLKFYAEKEAVVAWKEPKSTQHKDLGYIRGSGNLPPKEDPKAGEIYSRSNIGAKKPTGHFYGSQQNEPIKTSSIPGSKYGMQSRKAPAYESIMEQQNKGNTKARQRQYYC